MLVCIEIIFFILLLNKIFDLMLICDQLPVNRSALINSWSPKNRNVHLISGVDWLFDWWPNLTCIFTGDYIYIMSDTRKKRYSTGIRMRSDNGEGFHRNSSAAYNKTGRNNNPQNLVRIRNEHCWQLNIYLTLH
jgi:hypothetical protein